MRVRGEKESGLSNDASEVGSSRLLYQRQYTFTLQGEDAGQILEKERMYGKESDVSRGVV